MRSHISSSLDSARPTVDDLSRVLDQTKPSEYIEWNRRRIISCLHYLVSRVELRNISVLDLGHDTHVGALLAYAGCKLRGNVAPEGIPEHESARDEYRFTDKSGQIWSWPLDAFDFEKKFPYQDAAFDLITAMEIIEHISGSPRDFLKEIRRVLKPSGYLFIATPNAACWTKIMRQFSHAPTSDSRAYSASWGPRHPMCHVYEYTPWELRELLELAGFDVIDLRTWDAYSLDPSGFGNMLLKGLISCSLAVTGHVREAVQVFRQRGHQIGLLARISQPK